MILQGRTIYGGKAYGTTLTTTMGISFYGGVDPDSGIIIEKNHDLYGQSINGRILVFPSGKGSTVGSYTLYRLKKNNKAPLAIINRECETIIAVGCIISEIPCIDLIPIHLIINGCILSIDAERGTVTVEEPAELLK
jgi:predicted aconitase with swiveling domain